jgi:2-hydroxy-6-oxonona-2,4-dienedioate hydrolase
MALTDEGLIEQPGVLSRYVRLTNGARAHYVTAGESGPPVILLHGGIEGSSGQAGFRFLIPFLAEHGFRVYAPDRPGFGLADTRPEYWPTRGFVSWSQFVKDFADALCLERFFLSGNSHGAQTAVYFAVNNPERVIRMPLIGTAGFTAAMGVDPSRMRPTIRLPRYEYTEESMRDMLATVVYKKQTLSDDLVKMRVRHAELHKESLKAARQFMREHANDPDYQQQIHLKGRLDKLSIPMIYLFGKQDTFAGVENAYLQEEALPNIQFFYLDDAGHQVQTDQPEIVHQVFLEFLKNGKVSRATADRAGVSKRRAEIPILIEQT